MKDDSAKSLHTPGTPLRRPSRLRGAYLSLLGRPTVPDQIRAEWAGFLWEAEAVFDKLGAAANRLATRDKRELDKALKALAELELERESAPCAEDAAGPGGGSSGRWAVKAELGRRYAALHGKTLPSVPTFDLSENGDSHVDGDQGQ